MSPEDVSDFVAECVDKFLNDCGIEPPLYLVAIGANGLVHVSHWPGGDEGHEVCTNHLKPEVLPIVLTVISLDGRGASARIAKGDHGPRLLQ